MGKDRFEMMRWTLGAVAVVAALGVPATAKDGWTDLFDGTTLNGWIQKNGTAKYRVEDRTIVGTTNEGSRNSFLCTSRSYDDFELTFDVRVDSKLNSGVQIRSKTKAPTDEEKAMKEVGRVFGPQVEIEAGGPDGSTSGYVYGEATGRGWLTPDERRVLHDHFRDGEWNSYRIVARGPRIETFVNGQQIDDLVDQEIYQTHDRGFIGLQVHAIPERAGPYKVVWRNIRLREL